MNWINNVVRPKIRNLLPPSGSCRRTSGSSAPTPGRWCSTRTSRPTSSSSPAPTITCAWAPSSACSICSTAASTRRSPVQEVPQDPLKFRDGKRYTDRLKASKSDTGLDDAVLIGEGLLEGQDVVVAAQDFRFMAGSLGMAAGEAVITGMLRAVERRTPFILFAASGGARMQEGILSLMQMPRTTIAVQRLRDARLPYLVVLTDPTTGGVTASYAMLGDVHIAEPGALICFAGPRVIQQTIREQLPEGFQKAEYLLAHGMIDMVVHRHKLRETLARLCRLLSANAPPPDSASRSRPSRSIAAISTATRSTARPSRRWPARSDVMEPEPLDDDERFESRDKTKPRPGSGPRG